MARDTTQPPAPTVSDDHPDSDSDYTTDEETHHLLLDLTIPQPLRAGPSTNPHTNTRLLEHSARTGRPPSSIPAGPLPPWTIPASASSASSSSSTSTPSSGKLQLLALDTQTPLVSYQNRVWTGKWFQSVGTEMYISAVRRPEDTISVEKDERDTQAARRLAGGYYYPARDRSDAKQFTHTLKTLKERERRRKEAGEGEDGGYEVGKGEVEEEVGRVVGISSERLAFQPSVVKAREWMPGEKRGGGGSGFLRRLHKLQVEKGEIKRVEVDKRTGRRRAREEVEMELDLERERRERQGDDTREEEGREAGNEMELEEDLPMSVPKIKPAKQPDPPASGYFAPEYWEKNEAAGSQPVTPAVAEPAAETAATPTPLRRSHRGHKDSDVEMTDA